MAECLWLLITLLLQFPHSCNSSFEVSLLLLLPPMLMMQLPGEVGRDPLAFDNAAPRQLQQRHGRRTLADD